MRPRLMYWLLLAALLSLVGGRPAHASRVRLFNLDEVVGQAGIVLLGSCEAVSSQHLPGQPPSTTYTFRVERDLKGAPDGLVDLKMLAVSSIDGEGAGLPGVPHWEVGQRLVLFMNAPSDLGFTSPVGLFQGVFPVVAAAEGPAVEISPLLLRESGAMLQLTPTQLQAFTSPQVPLDRFLEVVESLITAQARP